MGTLEPQEPSQNPDRNRLEQLSREDPRLTAGSTYRRDTLAC